MTVTRPRLIIVGPLIGRNTGQVTTPGEILADGFAACGYDVLAVSSHPNRYMRLYEIVRTLCAQHRAYDLMLLNVYGGPSFVVEDLASWLGRRFGLSVIFHLHGGALPDFFARWPNWTRRVLRRAHRFVTPSSYLSQALTPYGFQGTVIPNSIELSDYPFRLRERPAPRLLWMRSFHDVWNPLMALRVFARLRQHVPHAALVMAGQDKGLQDECKRQARELGLANAVEFPGFLDRTQKIAYGQACDIYLNTNRIDNMPVAVVEACAFGLPVVSTSVGGIPDLLTDGETGLLVASEDDDAMVAAILRLLNEPNLAANLSNNGRKLAERSAWESVRQQWEAIFGSIKED